MWKRIINRWAPRAMWAL